MRITAKIIAILVLSGLLALPLFAVCGCDGTGGDSTNDGKSVDLGLETVILTIDDSPVYWPEFLYWLRFVTNYYEQQNGLDAITDWTAQVNGVPLKEFMLSSAVDYVGRHRALEAKAADMGVVLSEAQEQEMANTRADNVSVYGSESEYQRIVRQTYVSESVLNYLLEIGYLSQGVFTELYGANSEKCTDADVSAYVAEKGLLCARYVFLSNTGTGTAELSDAEKTKNRSLLEDLVTQLKASSDPVTLFAGFVTQYNQDTDAAGYTDGVLFTAGQKPADFTAAYNELKDSEYSGVVQTDGGLYLIMKAPIKPDMVADQTGKSLRYRTAYDYLFQKQVNAWYAGMKVKFTKAYDGIDLESLFGPDEASSTTTTGR
jgi:hypothetical protein